MTPVEVDVKSTDLKEALSKGAVPGSDSAWWYAFRSGQQPTFVFDGLASSRDAEGQGGLPRYTRTGTSSLGFGLFQTSPSGRLGVPAWRRFTAKRSRTSVFWWRI